MSGATDTSAALDALNALTATELRERLGAICGAGRWIDAMMASAPFGSRDELVAAADAAEASMVEADWLEAIGHHPRIGDPEVLAARLAAADSSWSSQEQAGFDGVDDELVTEFIGANNAYERRFGFGFLICATGRSARDMLAALRQRLGNDRKHELRAATAELAAINRIRIDKLLQELTPR